MNFGLTGIGIGGLYYIGCAIIILIIEGYKKIRSRQHKHPRRLVIDIIIILIGIAGATLLTDKGLSLIINYIGTNLQYSKETILFAPDTGLTAMRSIVISAGVLIVVLIIANHLRFFIRSKK